MSNEANANGSVREDLERYRRVSSVLETTQNELEELEHSEAFRVFQKQLGLLRKRLLNDPQSLRQVFVADGTQAIIWEFKQDQLGAAFVKTLWNLLLRDDDMSTILQRFIWNVPLKFKRKFIAALDAHLSDRYPMFAGLSKGWPGEKFIPPYVRPAEERAKDFELVTMGYLGYRTLGYSARECDLFVWLEVLRDKQCDDRPCEVGVLLGKKLKGGCPVKIHIPEMMELLGTGKFKEALKLIEACNPLPNVTGRVCPQENQCQGVCTLTGRPIEIGQLEWYLPERERLSVKSNGEEAQWKSYLTPWQRAEKPPIAVVGSGPAGLINAYLLSVEGFPVTVFEAFHELGGVLRYGIPEFRLPNVLIDDVVDKIIRLGGKFVPNFVVGKTATLQDLKQAGFWKIFVGTGAGLPRFMNVPGEELNGVMSANEFLTRVNLLQARMDDYETPLPIVKDKKVIVIGAGNTAMDSARTSLRLGGDVTIVYRRTRAEMPVRKEELEHALEEGVKLKVLRAPQFFSGNKEHRVCQTVLDVMELGPPDASGRRSPVPTGQTEPMEVDLVIMALGNASNPIIKDSEPRIKTTKWGTIDLSGGQQTTLENVYSGGDATRGGSTAINAAGDGKAAAEQISGAIPFSAAEIKELVAKAEAYSEKAAAPATIFKKTDLSPGIVEFTVNAPVVAQSAKAGQFVRVLSEPKGELIPLTLADWDADKGTIDLVIQGIGASTILINKMEVGQSFTGVAGPLGQPSKLHRYEGDQTVVFCAGGVGLPPVYPILREHLRLGNHVTLIAGYRTKDLLFWTAKGERVDRLQQEFGDRLDVIYATNDGTFGVKGFVTTPLEDLLQQNKDGKGRKIAEVIAIGPPLMMRAVSELTKRFEVKTVVSLNSIMVDATGMCGACMVPVTIDGKMVRKHACIDGPELDAHIIDWDKYLPRFDQFKAQEQESRAKHGLV
jgi:glutamate synthase (NADPH/NADH) small chain